MNPSLLLSLLLVLLVFTGCNPNLLRGGELDSSRVQTVREQTEKIRELSFNKEIPIKIVNRDELRDYFEKEHQKEFPGEKLLDLEKAYKKIGFLASEDNLTELMNQFKAEEVVGVYDDVSKEIFLLKNPKGPGITISLIQTLSARDSVTEMVLAHELTHGLQDQHFDLQKIGELGNTNQDFALATSSLIEGDADYASQGLLNPLIIPDRRHLGYLEIPDAFLGEELLTQSPKVLVLPFIFQYLYGAGFVDELIRSHKNPQNLSFKPVNACFKDLPQSTEQIIDPKKYLFQRDNPTPVSLASLPFPPGWKLLHEDTMGQLLIGIWISEMLSISDAYQVSDGWDGDRYAVFEEPKTGRLIFLQASIWDAEIDAIQYFKACHRLVQKNYPDFKVMDQTSDLLAEWVSPTQQKIYLKRIHNKVFLVDGVIEEELTGLKVPFNNLLLSLQQK